MASACVISLLVLAKLNSSSQVISRMVLPVMEFLIAPKSFEFVSICQFYTMIDVAVTVSVVTQKYKYFLFSPTTFEGLTIHI